MVSGKWWFVLYGFREMVVCVAWFQGCDGLFQVYGRLCCLISGIWRSVLHGFQGCNGLCQEYGGPFCIISWIRRSVLVAGTLNSPITCARSPENVWLSNLVSGAPCTSHFNTIISLYGGQWWFRRLQVHHIRVGFMDPKYYS